jgi:hypothetical protein
MRVYRLETDEGERLLGRLVNPDQMAQFATAFGLNLVQLTAAELYTRVSSQWQSYPIGHDLMLRTSTVMGTSRLEVAGTISEALGRQLKATGCFTEIICWRTRYFIPMNETIATAVIDRVMNLVT